MLNKFGKIAMELPTFGGGMS